MFIALEGIDAAGKTSIARQLVSRMRAQGTQVHLAAHNSSEGLDEPLARYLDRLAELRTEATAVPSYRLGKVHWALIRASYYSAVDQCVVAPALESGKTVVADGWYYKFASRLSVSVAPQEGYDSLAKILPFFDSIRKPDRVFLIDVPAEVAAMRRHTFARGETGPMPDAPLDSTQVFIDYQSQVRSCLRSLAQTESWSVLVNPSGPEDAAGSILRQLLSDAAGDRR